MRDEFLCETAAVRRFVAEVQDLVARHAAVEDRLAALRPVFDAVLQDPHWLPEDFRRTCEQGGMGAGIANWLLYRDRTGCLSLSALVLPPGASTPVHDHLAWGLVGLYAGEQEEEVYTPAAPVGNGDREAALSLSATHRLQAGSFYELIPPAGDIHRVTTTGAKPSISLHLLGNDVGCVWRHRFEPGAGTIADFRSGYTNRDCDETRAARR